VSGRLKGALLLAALAAAAVVVSLSARARMSAGYDGPLERFAPCPDSRNCVSTDATDPSHALSSFDLAVAPGEAWGLVIAEVSAMEGVDEIAASADYLHATFRSRLFGFVDDLEVELRGAERVLAVRSASRIGRSDLGVNRRRVEALRAALVARGAVR